LFGSEKEVSCWKNERPKTANSQHAKFLLSKRVDGELVGVRVFGGAGGPHEGPEQVKTHGRHPHEHRDAEKHMAFIYIDLEILKTHGHHPHENTWPSSSLTCH